MINFADGGNQVYFGDRSACGDPEVAGTLSLLDLPTGEVLWSVPWVTLGQGGVSAVVSTRGGEGRVGIINNPGLSEVEKFSAVEILDQYSGAVHLRVVGSAQPTLFGWDGFSGSRYAAQVWDPSFEGVAVFDTDLEGEVTVADAMAYHHPPFEDDRLIGDHMRYVGDPDGDGLDDLVVQGGGVWLLTGELVGQDEGILAADSIYGMYSGGDARSISALGDVTGDGYDDFSTSSWNPTSLYQVISGGSLRATAQLSSDPDDRLPYSAEGSITGAGQLGNGEASGVAVMLDNSQEWETAIWLVAGPLCEANYIVEEVGERVGESYPFHTFYAISNESWILALNNGRDEAGEYIIGEYLLGEL